MNKFLQNLREKTHRINRGAGRPRPAKKAQRPLFLWSKSKVIVRKCVGKVGDRVSPTHFQTNTDQVGGFPPFSAMGKPLGAACRGRHALRFHRPPGSAAPVGRDAPARRWPKSKEFSRKKHKPSPNCVGADVLIGPMPKGFFFCKEENPRTRAAEDSGPYEKREAFSPTRGAGRPRPAKAQRLLFLWSKSKNLQARGIKDAAPYGRPGGKSSSVEPQALMTVVALY